MAAYYNEIDPYAASWLRNLIDRGLIAPGDVDERSIEDIYPDDLRHYTQCHFFAGIGVWSYALRQAGWPDDRPVWTGSCPCQPFSAAGKGAGFSDERHLWPAWFHLITQCQPERVYGEQVASKDGLAWLDLVQADLEAACYTSGAADICAAGVGAPHIRQRLWFVAERVADTDQFGRKRVSWSCSSQSQRASKLCEAGIMADAASLRCEQGRNGIASQGGYGATGDSGAPARMGDAQLYGSHRAQEDTPQPLSDRSDGVLFERVDVMAERQPDPSPTNGLWRDVDWLFCRDGKWRPVESGTFPLVDGASNRVGRLRAYGNAINSEVAKLWIEATL